MDLIEKLVSENEILKKRIEYLLLVRKHLRKRVHLERGYQDTKLCMLSNEDYLPHERIDKVIDHLHDEQECRLKMIRYAVYEIRKFQKDNKKIWQHILNMEF